MRENETKRLRQFAKQMRFEMTDAERNLWYHLRNKRFCGIRFNRQVVIGRYIVDFLARQQKLVIELDGEQHAEQVSYDAIRTQFLNAQGYTVLRFWNDEVLLHIDDVLDAIFEALWELDAETIKHNQI